ncbi:sugar ABC transporter permease [Cohnella sp. CIP 111063]|uniref:carbohydrate ABC transporter permease n=1 Tax=unclassified Cohnella TaxID=2636738 RepID=UPI000B8BE023|nr:MULTISPECIES: carbohydrate ABC transporter permease [unclassified Cohnella]OXS53666.1 sugar ABC transporter permease [Cohnella sp. CIP 111063]PRX61942.1 carbohydrate ABC transporter membrane protein 2 (CUT1 family) [Cohnella sp. SGD-V74]
MKKITLFGTLNTMFIALFSLICTIPMLLVLMVSFTDEKAIQLNGYQLFPEKLSLGAYKLLLLGSTPLYQSYMISILITVVGTLLAVFITGAAGYTLSSRHVKYRNHLAMFFFVTMVFNTGIVPWYLISTGLGLRNTIWALIVPSMIFNPFNLFLVRNYMKQIPDTLTEAARIDGANDFYIALRIFFPLSLPVLATVTLFYGIGYWNNWFNAIMLVDNKDLFPLQFLLFKLNSEISMIQSMQRTMSEVATTLPAESVKMATAILTIGPIVFFYPFLQKYFIKGLLIGSVKE